MIDHQGFRYFLAIIFFAKANAIAEICHIANICQQDGINANPLKWFETSKTYVYGFNTYNKMSITGRYGILDDSLTANITGELHISRKDCGLIFSIHNLRASYPIIGDDFSTEEEELNINGSGIVAFKYNVNEPILCLPDDEQWKNNIRRSIIMLFITDPEMFKDEAPNAGILFNKKYGQLPQSLHPTWTNFAQLKNNEDGGHYSLSRISILRNFFNFVEYPDIIVSNWNWTVENSIISESVDEVHQQLTQDVKHALYKRPVYGIQSCLFHFDGDSSILNKGKCQEEQLITGGSQMTTILNTQTTFQLNSPVLETPQNIPEALQLFKSSLHFDAYPSSATKDPKVHFHFSAAFSKLCKSLNAKGSLESEEILKFLEYMIKLTRIIPVEKLREEYEKVRNECGVVGEKIFLDLVTTSPSDDSVDFITDLALNDNENVNLSPTTFQNFLWVATQRPPFFIDEESYFGSRTLQKFQKIIQNKEKIIQKFQIEEDKFFLQMASVTHKINYMRTEENEKSSFVSDLMSFLPQDNINRNLKLEVVHTIHGSSEECNGIAHNDFEKFKCYDPCNFTSHGNYVKEIIDSEEVSEDVKIAAYLFMRKCFISDWRILVKEYLGSNDANEEVAKFINYHSWKISDPINSNVAEIGGGSGDPEVSRMGRTFYHLSKSEKMSGSEYYPKDKEYVPEIIFEGNLVLGTDFIPRLMTLKLAENTVNGRFTPLEVEILRSDTKEEGKFDLLITKKESGGVTTNAFIVLVDVGKIQAFLKSIHEQFNSKKNALVSILKSKVEKLMQKLFQNTKIQKTSSFQMEDKLRKIPTALGLPINTRTESSRVFSLNYTFDIDWREGEYFATFDLHPSFAWERIETNSLDLGHSSIIGHQIGAHQFLNLNFGIDFFTTDDQRKFYSTYKFFSNSDSENFLTHDLKLLKMARVQFLNSYTKIRKSEHLWDSPTPEGLRERNFDFGNHFALLEGGRCLYKSEHQKNPSRPFFYSSELSCRLPDFTLTLDPLIRSQTMVYLEAKLFPKVNATKKNSYASKLSLITNRKGNERTLSLSLDLPSKQAIFNVSFTATKTERALKLKSWISPGFHPDFSPDIGAEIYLRQKPFDDLDLLQKPLQFRGRRNIDDNNQGMEAFPELLPISPKTKIEFGLKGWKGIKEISMLVGGLVFVDQELLHLWLESRGICSKLDTDLMLSLSTKYNFTKTLDVNSKEPISAVGDKTSLTLEIDNGHFGHISFNSGFFFLTEISTCNAFTYLGAHNVWIAISSQKETIVRTLLQGDATGYSRHNMEMVDDKEFGRVAEKKSFGFINSPAYPIFDITFEAQQNSEHHINNLSDNDHCRTKVNITEYLTIQLTKAPSHAILYSNNHQQCNNYHEVITQNTTLDLSLGHFAYFKKNVEKIENVDMAVYELGGRTENASCLLRLSKNMTEKSLEINTEVNKLNTNEIYRMNHKLHLLKDQVGLVKYNGELSKFPGGPRFDIDGFLQAFTESMGFKFNASIKKDNWEEPVLLVISQKIDGSQNIFIMKANDSSDVYLDSKFEIEPASPKLSATFMAKGFVSFELTKIPGDLKLQLDLIPVDIRIKANTAYESTKDTFFKSSVTVHSLEDPSQRHLSFDTTNEINRFKASQSILEFQKGISNYLFKVPVYENFKILSKTKFRIKSISQKITFSGQLYPNEDNPVSSLYFEFILPTADKFLVDIKKQIRIRNDENTDIFIGHWITMEQPGYDQFKTLTILKGTCKTHQGSGENFKIVDRVLSFEHKAEHHDFPLPLIDTEFKMKADIVSQKIFTSKDDIKDCSFNGKLNLKAIGRQNLPETKMSLDALTWLDPHSSDYSHNWKWNFRNNLVSKIGHVSLNATREFQNSEQLIFPPATNTLDNCLRTIHENGTLYHKHNVLDYKYSTMKQGREMFNVEGSHQLERVYETWRKFDVTATHSVNVPFLRDGSTIAWEDKMISKISPENNDGVFSISSSTIFNLTLQKATGEKENTISTGTLEVYPQFVKTLAKATLSHKNVPNQMRIELDADYDSVLIDGQAKLKFDHLCTFPDGRSLPNADHATKLVYLLPKNKTGQIDSFIEYRLHNLDDGSGNSVELVKHTVQIKGSHEEVLNWASISAKLSEGEQVQFLHYDFSGESTKQLETLHKVRGVFSSSVPFVSLTSDKPQIVHFKFECENNNDEKTRNNYFEAFLRLGTTKSNAQCEKRESKQLLLSSKFHGTHKQDELLPTQIVDIYNYKLSCDCEMFQFSSDGPQMCGSSFGHFYSRRLQMNDTLENLEFSPYSILQKYEVNAIFSAGDDNDELLQCNASLAKSPKNIKNMSSSCTKSINKIREKNPCLHIFPLKKFTKCDKSSRPSKIVGFWNKVANNFKPLGVTIAADSALIGWHIMFF